jgi:acetoin:2,6-dichlorophenolindophenol oxidoreductase subunit alpha
MLYLYEQMLLCMHWEQRMLQMIDEGKVSGFFHAGRGQEGTQVGAIAALSESDYLMYAHRGVGYLVARGIPLAALFGDFLANTAGTTRGLGAGIVHIAAPELGVLGQSGTLGGCFPIAAGAALSAQYRGTTQACLCFFGDGTANRGTFHEAANAASVWKLPVVWLCENNGWAVSSPLEETTSVRRIADRAASYGMPGETVDGQDALAVYEAVAAALERCRRGEGPTLIEAITYRFRAHYEGGPDGSRNRNEVALIRQEKDPILLMAARLREAGSSDADLAAIATSVQERIAKAALEAEAAASPTPDRLHQFVWA